jgi:hypothetical protein
MVPRVETGGTGLGEAGYKGGSAGWHLIYGN